MAKKTARDKVRLNSSAKTGVFYTTTKRKGADKIVKMMYDKVVRKHVLFEESKKGF